MQGLVISLQKENKGLKDEISEIMLNGKKHTKKSLGNAKIGGKK